MKSPSPITILLLGGSAKAPSQREGEKADTIRLREFAFAFLKFKSKFPLWGTGGQTHRQ
jgi:hypothetical protein